MNQLPKIHTCEGPGGEAGYKCGENGVCHVGKHAKREATQERKQIAKDMVAAQKNEAERKMRMQRT